MRRRTTHARRTAAPNLHETTNASARRQRCVEDEDGPIASADRCAFCARWRRRGSNPRPSVCQTDALPTELRPRDFTPRRLEADVTFRRLGPDSNRLLLGFNQARAPATQPSQRRRQRRRHQRGDRGNRTHTDSGHDRAYGPPYEHRSGASRHHDATSARADGSRSPRNSNLFEFQTPSKRGRTCPIAASRSAIHGDEHRPPSGDGGGARRTRTSWASPGRLYGPSAGPPARAPLRICRSGTNGVENR